MTLKSLVTSLTAGAAAAAVFGGAAVGVTSIAVGAGVAAAAPAPELQGPLVNTLNALSAPGSFSAKGAYIQGGIDRKDAFFADRAYNNAAAKGIFPLTFAIVGVDQNAGVATANVTATAASGVTRTQPITFVAGPSPTGWQISKSSALTLVTSVG